MKEQSRSRQLVNAIAAAITKADSKKAGCRILKNGKRDDRVMTGAMNGIQNDLIKAGISNQQACRIATNWYRG